MQNPVIVSAVRTPIGKFMGTLAGIPATDLGALAVREAVARIDLPVDKIDEVIMGNVVGAGLGQNPARQAALGADDDVVRELVVLEHPLEKLGADIRVQGKAGEVLQAQVPVGVDLGPFAPLAHLRGLAGVGRQQIGRR